MHNPKSEIHMKYVSVSAPCKNCPKVGCGAYHTQCEPYLKYKEELEKSKKTNQELNQIANFRGMKGCSIRYKLKRRSNNYYIHKVSGGTIWR
jgi:hypothetical protein